MLIRLNEFFTPSGCSIAASMAFRNERALFEIVGYVALILMLKLGFNDIRGVALPW